MGANSRADVIAFVAGAVTVLALGVLLSVGLAASLADPSAGWGGGLVEGEAVQLCTASALVAALSGAASLLAAYLVRRPT